MEHPNQSEFSPGFYERNRYVIKGLMVAVLTLIMLIPASFIRSLVTERQSRQQEVTSEVSNKWADSQTVTGPVLMIPYVSRSTGSDGKEVIATKQAFFLPDELKVNGRITPEIRKRSLYEVALYRNQLGLEGSFKNIDVAALGLQTTDMLWQQARVLVGITDVRGLEENVVLNWNNTAGTLGAGVPDNDLLTSGLSTPVTISAGTPYTFSLALKLKGSRSFYVAPVGSTTNVILQSPWQHPAFDGSFLPSIEPEIGKQGFTANWNILEVSRNYPKQWTSQIPDLQKSAFGVRFVQPADAYTKTERSVKYAILFIALTFAVFFLMEIIQKKQVHPLQYVLVGLALCIFYTLLLSVSEYLNFNLAYLIAAGATCALIGSYVWSIYKSLRTGILFTMALAGLYGYIFILLQLEDYALLFGSIGLFIILAVLMYFSRKIDWYGDADKNRLIREANA